MRRKAVITAIIGTFLLLPPELTAQVSTPRGRGKPSLKDGITTFGDPPLKPGSKPAGKTPPVTTVTMELLTGNDGLGLKARDWIEALRKLDVVATVRQGRPDDKLGVTESGGARALRTVRVVGALDNRGRLMLPDQTFSVDDVGRLANWVKDLRTYGAQGSPDGQPAWGLSKEQFATIHAALKKPLAQEVQGTLIARAASQFELPRESPLFFTPAAERQIVQRGGDAVVGQSLKGVSQGTALAVILAEQGLGFRPQRQPDGKIQLTVDLLESVSDVWPVGWPREQELPATAPSLLQIKAIELDDEPLDQLLEAISEQIQMPILVDTAGLRGKGINLAEVKISFPLKKTTWMTAIREFTYKARARGDVVLDDAGRPFLWVVPIDAPPRAAKN